MKKSLLCMFASLVLLAGCSSYHTRMNVDPVSSPDSATQLLRNTPMLRSVQSAVFFNKGNIKDLIPFAKKIKGGNCFNVISDELEEVSISKISPDLSKLVSGKIFVDVQDMQLSAGQNDAGLLTSAATSITTDADYKYDDKRKKVFLGLVEDELSANGFTVAKNASDADYKMKIVIFEDGITSKKTTSILYSALNKTGVVGLDIKFINTTTGNTVMAYKTKNKSYLNRINLLYLIPKYTSSENLGMEY